MTGYEKLAFFLVGTPLHGPADWLRRLKSWPSRKAHPELSELYAEDGRMNQVLRRATSPTGNCVDVGCHLGVFLNDILKVAPRGKHYAVEPVEAKAQLLQKKYPQVTVVQAALSDATGTTTFFVNDRETAYSGLAPRNKVGHVESVTVKTVRLDELVDASRKIDLIKIDVNGADLMVLRGATALLKRDRPVVMLECTQEGLDNFGTDLDDILDVLQSVDYRPYTLKSWLSGGPPLSAAQMKSAMQYPFQAFNFVLDAFDKTGR